jgi:quinol monooxygenase YgiN
MDDRLHVIARIKAHPDTLGELLASMRVLVAEVRAEPGCLRYDLVQSQDDPSVLIFIEEWASRAEWEAHMQAEALQRHGARTRPEMVLDLEVHALAQIA